jgi:hypothetical protein
VFKQSLIVRREEQRTAETLQRALKLFNRRKIQVISGFIENEKVHTLCLKDGEFGPRSLTR